jgi:lysozyme
MDVLELCAVIAKPFEGLHKLVKNKVYAYHDPVGYPTIGYGHLLNKNAWSDLSVFEVLSIEGADELLGQDMKHSAMRALALSPVLLEEQNLYRWAAISDFVFNCGDGNYSISTLRKKVNAEEWEEASEQILKWDKAGGKKLAGLTRRREAESALLLKEL